VNVIDFVPVTFILDFDDDQMDINLTNFLKFFNTNALVQKRIIKDLQQKKLSRSKEGSR
jgi:predicted transcriptional regulator